MSTLKATGNLKSLSRFFSAETRTKKASLNAFAAVLDYTSRILIELIINPLLVAGLGDYGFGLWRILWRLSAYVSVASGRTGQALLWVIANKQTSSSDEEKRKFVGSSLVVWALFAPLFLLVGAIFYWFLPNMIEIPPGYLGATRMASALLTLNFILISLTDIPRSVLQGENLGYKRMGLSAFLIFAGGGLTVLAVYLDWGLVGVSAAAVASTIISGILFFQVVRSQVPWFGIGWPTGESIRWFFGLSGWFVIWKLAMQLIMASDVVVLGMFASVEMVTVYSLTKYIPEAMIQMIATLIIGIAPGLGGIIGKGNLPRAIQVRNEIMMLTWWLVTVVGTTMLLWNRSFVHLWVGKSYDAGAWSTFLIVIMFAQLTVIRNDANIIDLTLNVQRKVILALISATISLALAGILIHYFDLGIAGMCIGYMVGRLILTVGYPQVVGKFLGQSFASQFKSTLRPIVVSLLFFAAALYTRESFFTASWLGLTMFTGITAILLTLPTLYLGLPGTARAQIMRRAWSAVGTKTA